MTDTHAPAGDAPEPSWHRFVPERDRDVMVAAGYGSPQGLGPSPALLVIDVNYGFTGHTRAPIFEAIAASRTACGEDAWRAVAVIERLLGAAREAGVPVIYSTGRVPRNIGDMGRWAAKNARVAEDVADGAARARIVEEIEPLPGDVVLTKSKPSVFVGTDLVAELVERGVDSLLVVGGATSGCVRATVVDGFSFNFRMGLVEDGCFDRSEISHAVTLFDLQAKYADVLGVEAALRYLRHPGAAA